MMNEYYNKLAPFIKEFIYKKGWDSLNEIQNEACRVIFDTESHLLLSSGTATGKTEAAFLPALTDICDNPSQSIAILYIAPMKALINDQFERLDELLKEADIPVACWHGDILQSSKIKVIKKPSGVLQITPESIECMLINRSRDLGRLFGDLRYVIIDEVHSFMGTDRGVQIICQLERLMTHQVKPPRRIGLSATLGDYKQAEQWLASGTKQSVITICGQGHKKIKLSVDSFIEPILETDKSPFEDPAWPFLYEKSLGKRCIIFSNGRETADAVITNLKFMSKFYGDPDVYHVHHGSISSSLREYAESEMRENPAPTVIGATVTLEMGIDIGNLERVMQIGPPVSVKSLLQRLGRSGRRGNVPEMLFIDWNRANDDRAPFPYRISWGLIHIIAMLQLYLEERWIEPAKILKYPLSILYQQILSNVASAGELSVDSLCNKILSMENFSQITTEDLYSLIDHMVSIDHLQLTDERGLIIGLEGEKVVNNYKFYAVFPDTEEEWAVMYGSKKLGTIEFPVKPSSYFTIAGQCWICTAVDSEKRLVFVQKTKRKIALLWKGDRAIVHDRILERMKKVFEEDTIYPYLQNSSIERLQKSRQIAREFEITTKNFLPLSEKEICFLPWMGHIGYYTLQKIIGRFIRKELKIKSVGGYRPYFMTFNTDNADCNLFLETINTLLDKDNLITLLANDSEGIRQLKKQFEYKEPKYDRFIPETLLTRQVIEDYIDIEKIKAKSIFWCS